MSNMFGDYRYTMLIYYNNKLFNYRRTILEFLNTHYDKFLNRVDDDFDKLPKEKKLLFEKHYTTLKNDVLNLSEIEYKIFKLYHPPQLDLSNPPVTGIVIRDDESDFDYKIMNEEIKNELNYNNLYFALTQTFWHLQFVK